MISRGRKSRSARLQNSAASALELEACGHAQRQVDERVVEHGITRVDAGELAHPADLAQVVVGERDLPVEIHHPVHERRGGCGAIARLEDPERAGRVDAREKVGLEQRLRRHALDEVVGLEPRGHGHARLRDVAAQLPRRRRPGADRKLEQQRLDEPRAQRGREAPVVLEQGLARVTFVAGEDLVAAVAREHDAHAVGMRASRARKRRHGGQRREGLVVGARMSRMLPAMSSGVM
jgi:hypothetical protein